VTAAFAVIGNKMLVIPGDVDPLHMLRGTEADQYPFALVKAEHRLIVEDVGHRPVRRRLARHGAGMGMAEMAVDAQGAPVLPTVPPDEMQREHAFRSGVNIMMYMLTGNYKADQVHVPALLERLGQ